MWGQWDPCKVSSRDRDVYQVKERDPAKHLAYDERIHFFQPLKKKAIRNDRIKV